MARTRSGRRRLFLAAVTILIAVVATWWWRSACHNSKTQTDSLLPTHAAQPAPAIQPLPQVPPPPPPAATQPILPPTGPTNASASAVLTDAAAALAAGNSIQARRLLNQAADPVADSPTNDQILRQLTGLGTDMLFSPTLVQNDPLVIKHIVESGQNLQKIANLYKTTVLLICRINNLSSPNNLRQGQPLKIVLGPFHAVISKHNFRMSVYCQDTLVKVFPVGLGADHKSTPTGRWKISLKQRHPRYYPPDGGKILEPNDPENPLGGYWIALEGVEGEAFGQNGYGIHGTIEPDTIGKNASKGCIRMRNEDVAFVYEMLVVHDSIVTVKD